MTDEYLVRRFREWESALRGRTLLDEAERLRDAVVDPHHADAEACWAVMWDKPLYANTYVLIAERHVSALAPQMAGAWRFMGADPARFDVQHCGGSNRTVNFRINGSLAAQIRADRRIAPHRLYAIQGAARVLRTLVERAKGAPPFRDLAGMALTQLVPELRRELGRGWGAITVLHMLTDFGLAVKPDVHLVRAARQLGLLSTLNPDRVPGEKDAVAINGAVRNLADRLNGGSHSPAQLRYVDKVLMEAARQRLFDADVPPGRQAA